MSLSSFSRLNDAYGLCSLAVYIYIYLLNMICINDKFKRSEFYLMNALAYSKNSFHFMISDEKKKEGKEHRINYKSSRLNFRHFQQIQFKIQFTDNFNIRKARRRVMRS